MKNKYIPYIIGSLLAAALVILFLTGSKNKNKKGRQLDKRATFKRQDKIPYGTYAAYQNLKYIFPKATIYTNKYEPGYWDSLSVYDSQQALIAVCRNFRADEGEMRHLIRFVENGNDVFISAFNISAEAKKILDCRTVGYAMPTYFENDLVLPEDTLRVSLESPPFKGKTEFLYPGSSYSSAFTKVNESTTILLGNAEGLNNFIKLSAGKGNFYVHLTPTTFSNYFLLHKNNIDYYEKVLSVINPDVTKVVWDEYFLDKREEFEGPEKERKDWFTTLMNLKNSNNQKPFIPAFLLLILLLLLYVLLEMRRTQRYIPVVAKPRNDSLDFVKTIGRLYYDRGDHKNLSKKMAAYFLEHVRNKYKLPTGTLDEHFIEQLRFKTGLEEAEIRGIVTFIKYLDGEPAVSHRSLTDFHKQLESFYKKA